MYNDFLMCNESEFEKIAREYNKQNKAKILGLDNDNRLRKEELEFVLNKAAGLYFALKKQKNTVKTDIIKVVKKANLSLSSMYFNLFGEVFVPNVKEEAKNIEKDYIFLIKKVVNLLKRDENFSNLKEIISLYLESFNLFY